MNKPDERNYFTPRRKRKSKYTCQKKKTIGVIQRSTNFERVRFLISSGDVEEEPDAEFVP
jgi:hypothetical protein